MHSGLLTKLAKLAFVPRLSIHIETAAILGIHCESFCPLSQGNVHNRCQNIDKTKKCYFQIQLYALLCLHQSNCVTYLTIIISKSSAQYLFNVIKHLEVENPLHVCNSTALVAQKLAGI